NHLHRASEVISATLFSDDFRIDFSRRDVGILVKVDVDETFVVSEVEIGFGPVFGDENFSVLIRTHCSRVNVQIRIELLYRNGKPSVFQQSSQLRSCNAFAQGRNHSACYKNIFSHSTSSCKNKNSPLPHLVKRSRSLQSLFQGAQ